MILISLLGFVHISSLTLSDLSLLLPTTLSNGGDWYQILWRDKWKNREKTGKMLNFPGLWREIFTVCPWMVRTPPFYHSDPKCPLWLETEPENLKKLCFWTNFWTFLQFWTSPSPYFWAIFQIWLSHSMYFWLKFGYPKFCLKILSLSKVIEEKPLGVVGSTPPPPPRSGRITRKLTKKLL